MARSIQEIYNRIIDEKENTSTLDGLLPSGETYTNFLDALTSTSKVAIWRMWAYITAVAHYIHELQFDLFKQEVEQIAENSGIGTSPWYQAIALDFQYGDQLERIGFTYGYAVIDETKKIVKKCAIEITNQGIVIVKVLKEDGPLNDDEKIALESYLNKLKIAGTKMPVLSQPADVISLNYTIYYDPLTPVGLLQNGLDQAMSDFRDSLDFNGEFRVSRFTDALQAVDGVVDPVFNSATVTPFNLPSQDVVIRVLPVSGSFDYAGSAATMFTFIPQL
jgi:hypothetical protein